jgi:hypothetical protein
MAAVVDDQGGGQESDPDAYIPGHLGRPSKGVGEDITIENRSQDYDHQDSQQDNDQSARDFSNDL